MLTSLKVFIPLVALGVSSLSVLGADFHRSAAAETLVTCGPKGAAQIVKIVPAGCRVLAAASPPKQAGNAVERSQLGFYFNASVPANPQQAEAIVVSQQPAVSKSAQ